MTWAVILLDDVESWFLTLDPGSSDLVAAAVDLLEQQGPALRRPMVGEIKSSQHKNVKELRPGSAGTTEVRILFIFDPRRQAVLLVGGDKSGQWKSWYADAVKIDDARFASSLKTEKELEDRRIT